MRSRYDKGQHAFTLVELLVVIGIIAVLIGILLPALNRARKQSRAVTCLSNLRQMGNAWTMYLNDSKGRLPDNIWTTPAPLTAGSAEGNEVVWTAFIFGILGKYRVQSSQMLCPEAQDPMPFQANATGGIKGGGTARNAWTGEFQGSTVVGIRLDGSGVNMTNDASKRGWRVGSYGFNGHVYSYTPDPTKSLDLRKFGKRVTDLRPSIEVPIFYDCVWYENTDMNNYTQGSFPPPTNLEGDPQNCPASTSGNAENRFLLNRHTNAINVCFADGHSQRVMLSDTYNMKWTANWKKFTITNLPKK
jgi:prepilin-type N-terminal cleavage/methylation domain-containing protein/prepilin-type processing-associated H-X9-DG protein